MQVLVLSDTTGEAARVASGLGARGLKARDGPLRGAGPVVPAVDVLVLCLSRWSTHAAAAVTVARERFCPVLVVHAGVEMDHRFLFEMGLEDAVGPPCDALDSLCARVRRARERQRELGQTRILICGYHYQHSLRTLRNTEAKGSTEITLSPLQNALFWEIVLLALHERDRSAERDPPRMRIADIRQGQLATMGAARVRQLYYELTHRLRDGLGHSVFLGDLRQGVCLDPAVVVEEGPWSKR